MNLRLKRILLSTLLLITLFSSTACGLFTSSTTATTTLLPTTSESITSGTWWEQVVSIEVADGYQMVYQLGQPFNSSSLVVEAVNGLAFKTALTSDDYTLSGYDPNTAGLQEITVTYLDLTTSFYVYVAENTGNATYHLEVTPPTKTEYQVGETFDSTGLKVRLVSDDESFIELTETQYDLSGYNLSLSGTQTVTVETLGIQATFTINVTGSTTLSTYYASAEGLSGDELKAQLHVIINTGFHGVTYGEARYRLDDTDRDPNNPNNVILVYLGTSVSGEWDGGATWNREHVWPQSLLGVDADNNTVNAASDLQNLKPANPSVNSSRNNKFYDNITTSVAYAPERTEIRGDLARILFYMEVMYSIYHLVNTEPHTYEMGKLDTLLDWHELDPVDDFERNRNEVIFTIQHNRNPFIDYPHFVELIWNN